MPVSGFKVPDYYTYQNGFGCYHECVEDESFSVEL